MNRPDGAPPASHKARAAGLEMLGFGLIAVGTMLALAAIAGGSARLIAGGVGLVLVLIGSRIRRRSRAMLWASSECCPRCGYDLSMTPKRCPECGLHREEWPDFEPRRSGRTLVRWLAVCVIVTVAAGVVFYCYGSHPGIRWTSLTVLILGFASSAACVFSLPPPKG